MRYWLAKLKIESDTDFSEGQVLLFDKPLYWTSFDLVKKVKNLIRNNFGISKIKVGHAGTLDPLASGLMIICTGRATKTIGLLQDHDKEYLATFHLGATTPSYDLETEIEDKKDTTGITEERVREILAGFIGEQEQVPPIFSAKNIDGKRAYDYARRGIEREMKPNRVFFHTMELLEYRMPEIDVITRCSKGTYIRSLAHDIGEKLGCGAYLSGLRRTSIGDYKVKDAFEIEEFEKIISLLKQK